MCGYVIGAVVQTCEAYMEIATLLGYLIASIFWGSFLAGLVWFVQKRPEWPTSKWIGAITIGTAIIAALLTAQKANALDRCHIEDLAGGKSTCYLPANATTFVCEGQGKYRTANCRTKLAEQVNCELREPSAGREPQEVWCEVPMPAPIANAPDIEAVAGSPVRYVRGGFKSKEQLTQEKDDRALADKLAKCVPKGKPDPFGFQLMILCETQARAAFEKERAALRK